ncbi:MAG: glycosyltransferase family 2 protein [Pirellulales bacterium]|nr:glycosyltransferase family 2 protein [Pirellulales bacterium]
MKPLVTAFVTVYNEETWIERAVRSLLDQSLRDIEVLVLDDGSTDRTPQILDAIQDERLRVIHSPRRGRAAALALATTEARGKYLANLDADDEAFPTRLENQARFLEDMTDHGWVGCAEQREDTQRGENVVRIYPETDSAIRRQAAKCIPYCHSAVMFRRDLVQRGINYDPAQPFLIDFEFFIRVAKHCRAANLPEALVKRRVRNESYFQRSFSTQAQNRRLAYLCSRAIREFKLSPLRYVFPASRLVYPWIPNRLKRHVRAHNGLAETTCHGEETPCGSA